VCWFYFLKKGGLPHSLSCSIGAWRGKNHVMLTMMVHRSWCNLPQWWVLCQFFLNKNASDVSSAAFMWCIHAIVRCGAYHKIRGSALLSLSSAADKICMMMTRLACNWAIESSYWRMDNNSDVGLLMGYVLYQLPIELESMDLDTFSRWFGLHPSLLTSW
jgi:hypothetical protein